MPGFPAPDRTCPAAGREECWLTCWLLIASICSLSARPSPGSLHACRPEDCRCRNRGSCHIRRCWRISCWCNKSCAAALRVAAGPSDWSRWGLGWENALPGARRAIMAPP
jgi:hypothetical protein